MRRLRPGTSGRSEELPQLVSAESGLAEDRTQSPRREFSMERHDGHAPVWMAKLHVASSLGHLLEPGPTERSHHRCS